MGARAEWETKALAAVLPVEPTAIRESPVPDPQARELTQPLQVASEGMEAQYPLAAVNVATAYLVALRASPVILSALKNQADELLQNPLPDFVGAATALATEVASMQPPTPELREALSILTTSVAPLGEVSGGTTELAERSGGLEEEVKKTQAEDSPVRELNVVQEKTRVTADTPGSSAEAREESGQSKVSAGVVQTREEEPSETVTQPGEGRRPQEEKDAGASKEKVSEAKEGRVTGSPVRSAGRPKPRTTRARGSKTREGAEVAEPLSRKSVSQGKT